MSVSISVPANLYDRLHAHLLPPDSPAEQAAFLFAKSTTAHVGCRFEVIDYLLIEPEGIEYHSLGYLELTDATRARVIKKAHDLGTSLIEMHSHRLPFPAVFSPTDIAGLREFVPHVWWRLKGKPYLALVVAPDSFDAFAWLTHPKKPKSIDYLLVGRRIIRPTGLSAKQWRDTDDRSL
jgi:hypothetical protein